MSTKVQFDINEQGLRYDFPVNSLVAKLSFVEIEDDAEVARTFANVGKLEEEFEQYCPGEGAKLEVFLQRAVDSAAANGWQLSNSSAGQMVDVANQIAVLAYCRGRGGSRESDNETWREFGASLTLGVACRVGSANLFRHDKLLALMRLYDQTARDLSKCD